MFAHLFAVHVTMIVHTRLWYVHSLTDRNHVTIFFIGEVEGPSWAHGKMLFVYKALRSCEYGLESKTGTVENLFQIVDPSESYAS